MSVQVTIDAAVAAAGAVRTQLLDNGRVLATASAPVSGSGVVELNLTDLGPITLWSPENPRLYDIRTTLTLADGASHDYTNRIGFREATFTVDGFLLNGKPYKIFGLNRHQIYPYAGLAMPARVQRRDAQILRQDLNCNMVRCSHYPQSPHFLDACDELGLMVWQEPPGWQYLGDAAWQDLAVRNVHDMIVRDRSRPSVILWGIRLNETANDPALYARTARRSPRNSTARGRPPARWTSTPPTNWSADVFAFDDYNTDGHGNATLLPPLPNVPYLVTEAVGALDGAPYYRWTDTQQVLATQLIMHAHRARHRARQRPLRGPARLGRVRLRLAQRPHLPEREMAWRGRHLPGAQAGRGLLPVPSGPSGAPGDRARVLLGLRPELTRDRPRPEHGDRDELRPP